MNRIFPCCYPWKRTEIDCKILHSDRHCRLLQFNSDLDSHPVPVLGTGKCSREPALPSVTTEERSTGFQGLILTTE